jgi:phospholipase/carboxylesterase
MRHSARSGDAQLHVRPGRPSQPALAPGVHELAASSRPSESGGTADGPAALLFVPTSTAPGVPLLVFFHGAGGSAASSLRLTQAAAAEHGCLVLLPNSIGRTWDFIASAWGPDVNRLQATLEVVLDHFEVSRVAFAGFSDGASYALSVGLANGELAHTVLAFSPGFAAPPDRVGRPRVWISHGTEDAVLPIDRCARPIARTLTQAGYDVNYEEFAGPHAVPAGTVDRAVRWWLDAADS